MSRTPRSVLSAVTRCQPPGSSPPGPIPPRRHGGPESGPVLSFESFYRDIVPDERIVYSSTLSAGNDVVTVSVTTVELSPVELSTGQGGPRLVLTEQGTFLDGREEPDWRERGTAAWLDALGAELSAADPGTGGR